MLNINILLLSEIQLTVQIQALKFRHATGGAVIIVRHGVKRYIGDFIGVILVTAMYCPLII